MSFWWKEWTTFISSVPNDWQIHLSPLEFGLRSLILMGWASVFVILPSYSWTNHNETVDFTLFQKFLAHPLSFPIAPEFLFFFFKVLMGNTSLCPGSLQEQQMLFAPEPSLQPLLSFKSQCVFNKMEVLSPHLLVSWSCLPIPGPRPQGKHLYCICNLWIVFVVVVVVVVFLVLILGVLRGGRSKMGFLCAALVILNSLSRQAGLKLRD